MIKKNEDKVDRCCRLTPENDGIIEEPTMTNGDGGERPRGRPKLRWKDTARRDLKGWNIREEWATDRERWKGLCKTR